MKTEIFVSFILLLLLNLVILPAFTEQKDKAKLAEAKAYLHDIQLAIERYAVDKVQYPPWLIGGERSYSAHTEGELYKKTRIDKQVWRVSDVLLRFGYLEEYPQNPFVQTGSDGLSIHRQQVENGDGLRSGSEGDVYGTRFGAYCDHMGNVMADFRFQQWNPQDPGDPKADQPTQLTWAHVNYHQYDFTEIVLPTYPEQRMKNRAVMPGQFFYKAHGPLVFTQNNRPTDIVLPIEIDRYILGLYGPETEPGADIIGPEPIIKVEKADGKFHFTTGTFRSATGQEREPPYQGSPYGTVTNEKELTMQVTIGNPNGIRDGIALVVNSGTSHSR